MCVHLLPVAILTTQMGLRVYPQLRPSIIEHSLQNLSNSVTLEVLFSVTSMWLKDVLRVVPFEISHTDLIEQNEAIKHQRLESKLILLLIVLTHNLSIFLLFP